MSLHEIVLPETRPETEWVRGRALQKVSPTYSHASLQALIAAALKGWAYFGGHGRVGSEWRFRVAPPGEIVRPLVPDVAYLSYATLSREAPPEEFETPLGSPTVAVEILSPDDRPRDLAHKIETYLAAGTVVAVAADPSSATFAVHERKGERVLTIHETFSHEALPGFILDLAQLFERARS